MSRHGFDPGLTWFLVSLPAGGDAQKAGSGVHAEIERLVKDGVTRDELARARNQALADFWRGLATIDGKAQALGNYAVLHGGYQRLFDAPRAYESVTAEDIQQARAPTARSPSNRTVGVLAPAAAAAAAREKAR